MNFDTKIGNFLKSNNYTPVIIKKELLSLVIVYVIYIFIHGISSIIPSITNIVIISLINMMIKYLYYRVIRKDSITFSLEFDDYIIVNSIILSLILPQGLSILSVAVINSISSIVLLILDKVMHIKINYVVFTFLLFLFELDVSANQIINNSQEINIFIILIFIIINSFLSNNDCKKTNISLIYFFGLNFGIILYSIFNNIDALKSLLMSLGFENLIFATYVINDNETTSVIPFSQILYSIFLVIMAIVSIRSGEIYYILISIIVYNVFNKVIDSFILKIDASKIAKSFIVCILLEVLITI